MASDRSNTLLLIADISGYTRFMKQHVISLTHAKEIVVRLLSRLMKTAHAPLKVAELEGDAVFFYAATNGKKIDDIAAAVRKQIPALFSAFKQEIEDIDSLSTCACDACNSVRQLRLKQVVHIGCAEVEKIGQFEKLFGLDVIVVHRLLKNSVPADEYVLMTPPAFPHFQGLFGGRPEQYREVVEGVGELETYVLYPDGLQAQPQGEAKHTFAEKLRWRLEITLHTVADWLGLRKYSGTFRNIPA